jgi:hypothetical protein
MRFKRAGAIAFATGALLIAGCGGDDERNDETGASAGETTQSQTEEAPAATATFITPEEGDETSGKVTAKVKLDNFTLDGEAVGKSPQPGVGHLHFSMDEGKFDNAKYSGPNGELAEKLGVDGKYSPSIEPEITYENLPPGKHVLEVYLANNNHTDTGIEAETEFTVK